MLKILGVWLLVFLSYIQITPFFSAKTTTQSYTVPTLNLSCQDISFSADGNPFPLCPGGQGRGGNCTWWAWEQWHLLGYDLPLNWGNAADWIVDAEHTGLSIGETPRIGAIAVFPQADGVWALSSAGHVAFVTAVSDDGSSFNVTYQNYGDPTFMYTGIGLNVSIINQPNLQDGMLRFIYFPLQIDVNRLASLPGVSSPDMMAVAQANRQLSSGYGSTLIAGTTFTRDRLAFGLSLPPSGQPFNDNFAGNGLSDLLLYNRQKGNISILKLNKDQVRSLSSPKVTAPISPPKRTRSSKLLASSSPQALQLVNIGDAITPQGKWGSSLQIYVGDFSGGGESDILLYDRSAGKIQLLSLKPDLTIKKHVTITGIGSGWEIYPGRFDGQRTNLFMYKRFAELGSQTAGSPRRAHKPPEKIPSSIAKKLSPTPKPRLHMTPIPTLGSCATASPSPRIMPTKMPSPCATPMPTPSPRVTPSPSAIPSPRVTPSPSAISSPSVTPSPSAIPSLSPAATPTLTPFPTRPIWHKRRHYDTFGFNITLKDSVPTATATPTSSDLSGASLQEWDKQGRTANVLLLSFDQNFNISKRQQYTLWHASWEVYVGPIVNAHQDGIFLYDRLAGEGRLMDFDSNLLINDYQEMHNLQGNWMVSSGDFANSGRAQLLLYDPSTGNAQILSFGAHLALSDQKSYSHLGTNEVLYVGHFGMPTLSIMLYDPQNAQSTFVGFDQSLQIAHQYLTKSWDQSQLILVGAFLDRSRCLRSKDCSRGDDILVLDRKTGRVKQYVFSFGRQFQIYDNRTQVFIRQGIDTSEYIDAVDTTTFKLVATLSTPIRDEEIY